MDLNKHKIGERLLFSVEHSPREMREGILQEISPSRIYVRLGYHWFLTGQVTVTEVLPPHFDPKEAPPLPSWVDAKSPPPLPTT